MSIYQTLEYKNYFGTDLKFIDYKNISLPYNIGNKYIFVESALLDANVVDQELCDKLFSMGNSHVIRFDSLVDSKIPELRYKSIKHIYKSEFVLNLAEYGTAENYCNSFGKKTRQHLRYYRKNLEKYICNNNIQFKGGIINSNNSDKEYFYKTAKAIIELNGQRCLAKGFVSGTSELWIDVAWERGSVAFYAMDDVIVAGTISTYDGDEQYLHVIAHSPQFNSLNLGNLILLDTITEAYNQKLRLFNFLWGDCEYKSRFLAKEVVLTDIYVFNRFLPYFNKKILFDFEKLNKCVVSACKKLIPQNTKDIIKAIFKL